MPKTFLHRLRLAIMATFCCGTLLSTSCGQLIRDSVKNGTFAFISGSVQSGFNQQFSNFVTDVFTGNFFPGTQSQN
jgi:hypothetical protein